MAYTITQKATTPNAAYTRLIYTVSGSTNTYRPQFKYVLDIFESGSTDRLHRVVQEVNPAGVSVFDPSRLFQGELKEDQSWKISSLTPFVSSSKVFTLKFGEQYGTSISSSVVTVDDVQQTNTEVFRGVVEPNNGIGYDWQSSSYAVLSNMPATMSMQVDDYGTISVYNNDVSYVSQSFYSSSVSGSFLVQSKSYTITDNFSSIPISASTPYWNNAEVNVSSSLGLQSYKYEVSDETHREKTRFAFINKLGTWDFYNNYNPVRQSMQVKREQYTAPRVDYSSLTSNYDISRRGLNTYHSTQDDTFIVDTDFLDKTNANWIEELLESPSVFIQRNGEFIPIMITDSSYTANTNQARQKLFQYIITFKPSNQPFGKWEPEYVSCPKIQPVCPEIQTNAITDIDYTSLTLNGEVIYDGGGTVTRGFAWNSGSTPTIENNNLVAGTGEGIYSASLTGLATGSTFYVRAYASNEVCLIYGSEVNAKTLECSGSNVETDPITGTFYGGFTANGEVVCEPPGDLNVERGFAYSSTNANPSVSASLSVKAGSGVGIFSSSITCLTGSTDYYVRAYASSSGHLYYGDVKETTTSTFSNPTLTGTASGSLFRDLYMITLSGSITPGSVTIEERGFAFSSQSALPDISSSNSIKQIVAGGPGGNYEFIYTSSNAGTEYFGRAYAKYTYCGDDFVFYGNVASSSTPPFTGSLRDLDPYGSGSIPTASLLYWYDFTDQTQMTFTSSTALENYGQITDIQNKGVVASASLNGTADSDKYKPPHYIAPNIEQGYAQFYGGDNINSVLNQRGGDLGQFGDYPGFSSSSISTAIYFSWVDLDTISNQPNIEFRGMTPGYLFSVAYLQSHETLPGIGGEARWYSSVSSSFDLVGSEVELSDISSQKHAMATYYSYSGSNNAWQSTYLIVSGSPISGRTDYGRGAVTSSRAPGETKVSLDSNFLEYTTGVRNNEGLAIGGSGEVESKGNNNFKLAHFLLYTGSLSEAQITSVINDFSASVTYGGELNSISN